MDAGKAGPRRSERRPRSGRARLQRGIIILPSAFTLGNLFLGVYAMISAARGDFEWAAWSIVFAAILDMLDGRVARFTATGSRFGTELDSLVDVISFGVAPAFVTYELFFADQPWSWVLSFLYITAVAIRLARFNVEQGGHAKRSFHGLPSPTSGMVLATFYPFVSAPGVAPLVGEVTSTVVGILMIVLAVLMLSHVPYPLVPHLSFRGARATFTSLWLITCAAVAIAVPEYFIFPVLCLYTLWGVARSTALGLAERLPEQDPLLDEVGEEDEGGAEVRAVDYREIAPIRYPSPEAPTDRPRAPRSTSTTGGNHAPDPEET
jgi:CDP-diacylglycerol--serine O-phosphatidyltransferase